MFTIRLFNLLLAASVMITACAPSGAPTPSLPIASSAPTVIALPVPMRNIASVVWSEGLPPNGIWQATLTPEDYVERGVLRETAEEEWAGVYTWTFHDGKAQLDFEGPIAEKNNELKDLLDETYSIAFTIVTNINSMLP